MNTIFQVLTLAYTLQGGQYFNNAMNDAGVFTTNNNYFIQTSFEFQVPFSWTKGDTNNFFIGGETETQFSKIDSYYFSPWQDTYMVSGGIRVIGVEIGYQHTCSHPVTPDSIKIPSKLNFAFDKVYVKISGLF